MRHTPKPLTIVLGRALLMTLLGALSGCRKAPAPPKPSPVAEANTSLSALSHYLPASAKPDNRRPLLLFLHGYGDSGSGVFRHLELASLGERFQIAVVAPNGTLDSEGRRFWNAHPACCNFDGLPVDHVAELSKLVDSLMLDYPLDPKRLYVMGYSNGGFMANRLGCEWGDRLAGIASIAGSGPDARVTCHPVTHLRVLELHGNADKIVKYEGGTLFDRPRPTYASARDTFAQWAKRLGCTGTPLEGPPIDLVSSLDGEETNPTTYEHCARGSLSLWTTQGGSHAFALTPNAIERAWLELSRDPT